jgi:hypothetical protein
MAPFACSVWAAAVLATTSVAGAPDRVPPPRVTSASDDAFTDSERGAVVAWAMARSEVRAANAGHRTRLLRVWSDTVKDPEGAYRRATLIVRDYDAGTAREITVDLSKGRVRIRDLPGAPPSREEIEEGMAIVRADRALAPFVQNPRLSLVGGFHNRSPYPDDPCGREICLEYGLMKPDYEGPARYVIVNLTRRVVAHHDFRARPGEPPPRMTESAPTR